MQVAGGEGGGSGGRGLDSSARATTPGLLIEMPPLPQPYPPPAKVRGYRPPSHPRGGGGHTLVGGGEGGGSGAAKPPKPLPPPVLLAMFSARLLW